MTGFSHALYRITGGAAVDVKRAFEMLAPYLPGQWFMVRMADESHPAWLQLARLEDDLRLYVTWAPHRDDRVVIQVTLGPYRLGSDTYLDIARLARQAGIKRPMGRMSLTRNSQEAVAKDIIRRVITPGEKLLAAITAEISQHQQMETARKETLHLLAKHGASIAGSENRRVATVYIKDIAFRVDLDGSVTVQAFRLEPQQMSAFLAFIDKDV